MYSRGEHLNREQLCENLYAWTTLTSGTFGQFGIWKANHIRKAVNGQNHEHIQGLT